MHPNPIALDYGKKLKDKVKNFKILKLITVSLISRLSMWFQPFNCRL